jgi:DNA ligase (NAD+)
MSPAIQRLIKQLQDADSAYYNDGSSTLTDKEYDRLKDLLRNLDPDNAYLKEVAHENLTVTEWEKVKHKYPLGSLNKCNEEDELRKWLGDTLVVGQEKLDGLSIALTYLNGNISSAVTRGDGEVGDNILQNVVKMKGVPRQIKFQKPLVVRAEILLKHSEWFKMPVEDRGKNPRNTAAGAAKELNGSKCKYLSVVAYSILNSESDSEIVDLELLEKLGFEVVPYFIPVNIYALVTQYHVYNVTSRNKLDYDIDGLVIKSIEKDSSDDWKYPKSQIAWKFPHQTTETILRDVVWQVSGDRVTPVAVFDPVDLAGVTISRASLHNMEYIKRLNVRIGDKIEITRRNDVIPQVERVLISNGGNEITAPEKCPMCGKHVAFDKNINEDDMAWLVCTNTDCPAKVLKNIIKWLEVHDTKGVAEKMVETLFNHSVFYSLPDFLQLAGIDSVKEKNILSIEGMGEAKLQILQEQIKKTINCDLISFFGGLNVSGFGRRMWERIIKYLQIEKDTVTVNDVIDFISLPYMKGLGHIEGFAETNTKELQSYIKTHTTYINEMINIVKPQDYSKPSLTSENLKGKSFCFTGELTAMPRKEAQDAVLRNGGEIKSSVTKGLTYLVTNDPNSGSTKNKKAQALGTTIIGEVEFLKLIK